MTAAPMAPGWYQDPFSSAGYVRWWDGQRWGPSVLLPEGMTVTAPGVPVPLPPPGSAPSAGPGAPAPPAPPAQGTPPASPTDLPPPPPGWAPPPGPTPGAPSAPPAYGAPAYGAPAYGAPAYGGAGYGAGLDAWSAGAPYRIASWGSRALAAIIDSLLVGLIAAPFTLYLLWPAVSNLTAALDAEGGQLTSEAFQQYVTDVTAASLAVTFVSLVVGFLYEVPQNRVWGRTLGKRAIGLRVRPRDIDEQLTWGQCVLRWAAYALPVAVVGLLWTVVDYLWPFWDRPWRQTLHDKLARTTVVPTR